MNEQTISIGLKEKNEEAFRAVMESYEMPLIRFFFYATSDNEVAKDLTYDTFFALFTSIDSFKQKSSLKNYIYAIGKNKLKDYYKKKKFEKKSTWQEIEFLAQSVFQFEVEPSGEKTDIIDVMLKTLPEKDKIIVEGFYLHKYSLDEIAKQLYITVTNVKVRKKRILDKLKKKFTHLLSQYV